VVVAFTKGLCMQLMVYYRLEFEKKVKKGVFR